MLITPLADLRSHLRKSKVREATSAKIIRALKEENNILVGALGEAVAATLPRARDVSGLEAGHGGGGDRSLSLYVGPAAREW